MNGTNYEVPHCGAFSTPHSHPSWAQIFASGSCFQIPLAWIDISYSVNYLSRIQNCYNETHFKYALRVLKYLYLTRDLKLTYCKNNNVDVLDCFVDADWAGDILDKKSTTGFFVRLFGNVINWKSKKQVV